MDALQSRAAAAESAAAGDAARRGRVLVWSVVAAWVPLEVIVLGGQFARPASAVVRIALTVFVFWRALKGSAGARRYLAFGSGAAFRLGARYAVWRALSLRKSSGALVFSRMALRLG